MARGADRECLGTDLPLARKKRRMRAARHAALSAAALRFAADAVCCGNNS